jgi:ABC-type transport system substrate-binding protein
VSSRRYTGFEPRWRFFKKFRSSSGNYLPLPKETGMKFGRCALTLAVATGTVSAGFVPTTVAASASDLNSSGTIASLTIGTNFAEPTLNAKNPYASWITALSLETLLKQVGPNNQLKPNLATSWGQTGPDTYVYHLRHGVKFWDGNEMTAADGLAVRPCATTGDLRNEVLRGA